MTDLLPAQPLASSVCHLRYFSLPHHHLLNHGETHLSGLTALPAVQLHAGVHPDLLLRCSCSASTCRRWWGIGIGFATLFMILRSQGLSPAHDEPASGVGHPRRRGDARPVLRGDQEAGRRDQRITYNTLPIGPAGMMLCLVGLGVEQPGPLPPSQHAFRMALTYLGLCVVVAASIVFFGPAQTPEPGDPVARLHHLPGIRRDHWLPVRRASPFPAMALPRAAVAGFAITKVPVEKLRSQAGLTR